MISSQGLDLSNPKIKTTIIHAALNDVAIFGAVYQVLSKKNRVGFMPNRVNLLLSGLMLGAVGYSSFLGGGLVYEHGVGVQRQGHGKEEKERGGEELKQRARKEL